MKLIKQKSFGYPVLRDGSDDYTHGTFQPTIGLAPVKPGDKNAVIKCKFDVDVPQLADLVKQKKASYVLVIACRDTFHRQCFKTNLNEEEFSCRAKFLKGKVDIECYIVADEKILDFNCKHIHRDYADRPLFFSKYSVLAQWQSPSYTTDSDKLKSRSLFKPVHKKNLPEGEWYVDIYHDRPEVIASPEQCRVFEQVSSNYAADVLANTVLVPIVIEMINALNDRKERENVKEFRWASIIEVTLQKKGLTLDSKQKDSFRLAQHFLDLPLKQIKDLLEGTE